MEVVKTVETMREHTAEWRRRSLTIGFVPTMGYLHEGHKALIRKAVSQADKTVVSIFVNPSQFAPEEDYEQYPRDLKHDTDACEEEGVDIVFTPTTKEMYPDNFSTWVEEEALSQGLCGAFRPGHFKGVTTVVTKLFNMVEPDLAVFGQKDAQQALIIQRLIRDLNFDIKFVLGPTVREKNGLALSCRNEYLDREQRKRASSIYEGLCEAKKLFGQGETDSTKLKDQVVQTVENSGGRIEYVEVVSREDLRALKDVHYPALIAVAAYFGETRLIDNVFLES